MPAPSSSFSRWDSTRSLRPGAASSSSVNRLGPSRSARTNRAVHFLPRSSKQGPGFSPRRSPASSASPRLDGDLARAGEEQQHARPQEDEVELPSRGLLGHEAGPPLRDLQHDGPDHDDGERQGHQLRQQTQDEECSTGRLDHALDREDPHHDRLGFTASQRGGHAPAPRDLRPAVDDEHDAPRRSARPEDPIPTGPPTRRSCPPPRAPGSQRFLDRSCYRK